MTRIRIRLALALLVLAAGGRPAAAAVLGLRYDGYASGLYLGTGDLRIDFGDRAYRATATGHGGWLVSLLTRWSYEGSVSGTLAPSGTPVPALYRGERHLRSQHEIMTLRYDPDRRVTVEVQPKMPPEKAALVPPEARPGTVDPLSVAIGIIGAAAGIESGERCAGHFPVYDGRRRYDVDIGPAGRVVLEPSRRSAFAGEAEKCTVKMRPVAGFQYDHDNKFFDAGHDRTASLWLGRFAPLGRVVPVRLEMWSPVGWVLVHLSPEMVPEAP